MHSESEFDEAVIADRKRRDREKQKRIEKAGPDLLRACEAAKTVFTDIMVRHASSSFHNNRITADCEEAIKFLEAAIAKAEGE